MSIKTSRMLRYLVILSFTPLVLSRSPVGFGPGCGQQWVPTVFADGTFALQSSGAALCLGTDAVGQATVDDCDQANARRWAFVGGVMQNVGSGLCLGPTSAGACLNTTSVAPSSTTASSVTTPISNAFDGSNTSVWVSARSYGPTGAPLATAPFTSAGGTSYQGEWIQMNVNSATRITGYSIRFEPTVAPASRRRPVSHVLLGSAQPGSWVAIGSAAGPVGRDLMTIRPPSTFSVAGLAQFSSFRLVVTSVEPLGDGRASVAELVLLQNPQAATLAPPSGPVVSVAPYVGLGAQLVGTPSNVALGSLPLLRSDGSSSAWPCPECAWAVPAGNYQFSFMATDKFDSNFTAFNGGSMSIMDVSTGSTTCAASPCGFSSSIGHYYTVSTYGQINFNIRMFTGPELNLTQYVTMGTATAPPPPAPGAPVTAPPSVATCGSPTYVLS